MYTEKDFADTQRQTRLRVTLGIILIAAFLALVIVLTVLRQPVWQMVAAGIGFIVCYFLWNMKIVPWINYNKFIKELKYGRKRTLECELVEVSSVTRQFDNVEVYDVTVKTESDDVKDKQFDERLFVLDADKKFPDFAEGSKIIISSFGNFITGVESAEKALS